MTTLGQLQQQIDAAGGPPNTLDGDGLCLLSIDGGGVRGLASLYILKYVMDRLNNVRREYGDDTPLKPCDIFDLIGGTSTGGLIAIMLGRLEMDVDQCIAAYNELSETVFGEKLHRIPMSWRAKTVPRFDSSKLEQAIRKVLRQVGEEEDALFNDGKDRKCKTFVCMIDEYNKDIVRLRDYTLPEEPQIRATVVQAARATSAATTFFEPVKIGNRIFSDGALGANNPCEQVEEEAADIWCAETADLKPLVKCFISIGTGKPATAGIEKNIFRFLGKTVVGIATETENTEKAFIARWRKHYDEDRYFRFNVEQGLQGIGLAEYQQKGAIETATSSYLTNIAQKFRVRDCVANLKKKKIHDSESKIPRNLRIANIKPSTATVSRKIPFMVPFEPDPDFVSRLDVDGQDILEKLSSSYKERRRIGLVGLGGVGKSQIAIQYAHQFRRKNPEEAVIWVQAGDLDHFNLSYKQAAEELGLNLGDELEMSPLHIAGLVCGALSRPESGNWLMILDNVDDIDVLTTALLEDDNAPRERRPDYTISRYIPRSATGSILVTSRSMSVVLELTNSASSLIHVSSMIDDEAKQLLQYKIWPHAYTEEEASEFVNQMERLPIAITQAAAYMTKCCMVLKEYIAIFNGSQSNQLQLLRKEFKDWRRDERPNYAVLFTWHTSFEKIRMQYPNAARMLSLMSIYHHHAIPSFLLRRSVSDQMELVDSLEPLLDFCLISRRPANDSYDLHIFVKLATRAWLDECGELDAIQGQSVQCIFGAYIDLYPDRLPDRSLLLMHFLEFIEIEVEDADDVIGSGQLLVFVGDLRSDMGQFQEAIDLHNRAISRLSGLMDAESYDLLNAQVSLSWALMQSGRLQESRRLAKTVRQTLMSVSDRSNWDVQMKNLFAKCLRMSAKVSYMMGQVDEGETCLRQGLDFAKATGDMKDLKFALAELIEGLAQRGRLMEAKNLLDDYNTMPKDEKDYMVALSKRINAFFHLCNADNKEARRLLREVWEERVQSLGETHYSTLTSALNYIGSLSMSDWLEIQTVGFQILHQAKDLLGDDNSIVWGITERLAHSLSNQGNNKKALSLFKKVLESKKKADLGLHPDSLTVEVQITELESFTSPYCSSLEKLMSMQNVAEKLHPNHFFLNMTIKYAIANLHARHGANELAESFFEQAIDTFTEQFGDRNMRTLQVNLAYANLLISAKKYKEGQAVIGHSLDILQCFHPSETVLIIDFQCDLARCHHFLQEGEKLTELYSELQQVIQTMFHCDQAAPELRAIAILIAVLFKDHTKYEWEKGIRDKILQSDKITYGPNHKLTLHSQSELALCLRNLSQCAEAETLDRETLALRTKWCEVDDTDIFISMNNLAMDLGDQERWEEAKELQLMCVQGRTRVLGEHHKDTLAGKHNLIWILTELKEYDSAETLAKEVYEKRCDLLGQSNKETLATSRSLAAIWRTRGKYSQIIGIHEQPMKHHETELGSNHLATLWTLWIVADSFTMEGEDLEMASQLFARVFRAGYHKSGAPLYDKSSFFFAYSRLLSKQSRYAELENIAREILADWERSYGPDNRESDYIKSPLASALREQNRLAEAVDVLFPRYLRETEETENTGNLIISYLSMRTLAQTVYQEQVIRPHILDLILRWKHILKIQEANEDLCMALQDIAVVLYTARSIEAHEFFQLAIQKSSEFYGESSKEVILQKRNMINNMWSQGLYSDSFRERRFLIQQFGQNVDLDRMLWLQQRAELAYSQCASGDISTAVLEGESIMKEIIAYSASNTLSVINQWDKFAYMVLLNGEWRRAEQIYRDNLQRHKLTQNPNQSTGPFSESLPTAVAAQGRWKEAMDMCTDYLKVDFTHAKWVSVSEFRGLALIALGRITAGQVDEGLKLAKQVYTEQSKAFGSHHPETLNRFLVVGLAYWHKGNYEMAEMVVRGTMESRIIVSGRDNPATLAATNLLGLIRRDMKAFKQAEQLLKTAYIGFESKLRLGHPDRIRALTDYIIFLVACWKAGRICSYYQHHNVSTCKAHLQVFSIHWEKNFSITPWL